MAGTDSRCGICHIEEFIWRRVCLVAKNSPGTACHRLGGQCGSAATSERRQPFGDSRDPSYSAAHYL